jgi:hypothetical protein
VSPEASSRVASSAPRPPASIAPFGPPGIGAERQAVKLRAHWVRPGDQDPQNKFICKEVDFDLTSMVFGTIAINSENVGHITNRVPVSPATGATWLHG